MSTAKKKSASGLNIFAHVQVMKSFGYRNGGILTIPASKEYGHLSQTRTQNWMWQSSHVRNYQTSTLGRQVLQPGCWNWLKNWGPRIWLNSRKTNRLYRQQRSLDTLWSTLLAWSKNVFSFNSVEELSKGGVKLSSFGIMIRDGMVNLIKQQSCICLKRSCNLSLLAQCQGWVHFLRRPVLRLHGVAFLCCSCLQLQ